MIEFLFLGHEEKKNMAALNSLIKRATSLLGGMTVSGGRSDQCVPPGEGEVIYCKNNVCVHPPSCQLSNINHYPGYLAIKGHISEVRIFSFYDKIRVRKYENRIFHTF